MLSVDEQMRIITSGAAQMVPEADLRKKLEKGEPLDVSYGVDPTSPDLHLGHAVPLRKMRQFQDLGHNATLIIGNGTALIGRFLGQELHPPAAFAGADRGQCRDLREPGHEDPGPREDHHRAQR